VYRGAAIPELTGAYFFADYCSGTIWSLKYDGANVNEFTDRTAQLAPGGGLSIQGISGFGEDGFGEMYIVDRGTTTTGEVYKILPDIKISWRDTLPGAALSAVGMALAVRLIGLYFQLTSASSAFAAAGSVAVLMVGINYLGQIFLFGAVVTRAYASHYGSRRPDPNIEPPDEAAREPTNPTAK
jgi:hypothetical protein